MAVVTVDSRDLPASHRPCSLTSYGGGGHLIFINITLLRLLSDILIALIARFYILITC